MGGGGFRHALEACNFLSTSEWSGGGAVEAEGVFGHALEACNNNFLSTSEWSGGGGGGRWGRRGGLGTVERWGRRGVWARVGGL